jgi:hypothetical protein
VAPIFHTAVGAEQRMFLPGHDVRLLRRNDQVTPGATVFLLSVFLADGLNHKPVASFGFDSANAGANAFEIQLVWLLVLIPVAAARHLNTNSFAENGPTQHTGFHSEQKYNPDPIESGFPGWSPNRHPQMPSWSRGALEVFRMRRCFGFEQSGSSQILWPTAHTGIGIQIRAGRRLRVSHAQWPEQFQDLEFQLPVH